VRAAGGFRGDNEVARHKALDVRPAAPLPRAPGRRAVPGGPGPVACCGAPLI
jgi:hypothetical protein